MSFLLGILSSRKDSSSKERPRQQESEEQQEEKVASSPDSNAEKRRSVSISNEAAAAAASSASSSSLRNSQRGAGGAPHRASFAQIPAMPLRRGLQNHRHQQSSSNISRARSLSRVFNNLPGVLPSFSDMLLDLLEYQLHVVLLETDWKRLHGHLPDLKRLMEAIATANCHDQQENSNNSSGSPSAGEVEPCRGRCFTRMKLSALAMDITYLRIEDDDDDDDVGHLQDAEEESLRSKVKSSLSMPPAEWSRLKEEWDEIKNILLRQDANTALTWAEMASHGNQQQHPGAAQQKHVHNDNNDMTDEKLAEHDMFQNDYHAVARLLVTQQLLALLREGLLNGVRHISTLTPEHVQQIIAQLEDEWQRSEYGDPEEGGLPKHPFDDILAPLRAVLVLRGGGGGSIANRVKGAMMASLDRYKQIALAPEHKDVLDSHVILQTKMRALLTMWSEKLLETPELFRVQYRGVTAPLEENEALKDNDDISSLGGDINDAAERDKEVAEMMATEVLQKQQAKDNEEEEVEEVDELFGTQPPEDEARRAQQRAQFVAEKRPLINQRESPEGHRKPSAASATNASSLKRKSRKEKDKKRKKAPPPAAAQGESTEARRRPEPEEPAPTHRAAHRPPQPSRSSSGGVDENVAPAAASRTRKRDELFDDPSEEEEEQQQQERSPPHPRRQKRQKRVPFSQDEADAIREGVERYGIGQWKVIKLSDSRLKNRDTVQIKDKYRNMMKNNQI